MPYHTNEPLDTTFDPTEPAAEALTVVHTPAHKSVEGENAIMAGGKNDIDWYRTQIHRVLDDKIEVHWFTTNSALLENDNNANATERLHNTKNSSFLRTWCLDFGRAEEARVASQVT